MISIRRILPVVFLVAVAGCSAKESEDVAVDEGAATAATGPTVCRGKGDRTLITLFTSGAGDDAATTVRVENLPSAAGFDGLTATIAVTNELTFHGTTDIAKVEAMLQQKPAIWDGLGTDRSFAEWRAERTCAAGTPSDPVTKTPDPVCNFDPAGDKPNPLGMRAFVSIAESPDSIDVIYEQFPSNVADFAGAEATLGSVRVLSVWGTESDDSVRPSIATVRGWVKDADLNLAGPLFEADDYEQAAKDYAEVDAVLKCDAK